ncbi:predicted protein [Botrytis cinerea T4]|uniref:Uncharacterized protein n=1 Tax=Botryotinia fuckeliana (strain T4) TaxID=999810 RepID=G2Y5D0_BOTF4|nr:predicted protein [Botrytis cinerea T4]
MLFILRCVDPQIASEEPPGDVLLRKKMASCKMQVRFYGCKCGSCTKLMREVIKSG